METTKRACKGGELGANGEWYEGGKFINTIPENAKHEGSTPKKARKAQIEPYVWVLIPEGKSKSIFSLFAGLFGKVHGDGVARLDVSEQTLNYFGVSREEAQSFITRYNAGERWA